MFESSYATICWPYITLTLITPGSIELAYKFKNQKLYEMDLKNDCAANSQQSNRIYLIIRH